MLFFDTENPMQVSRHLNETFKYNSIYANFGIALTRISKETTGADIGYCTSVEPVDDQYIDLELDRVSAMSYSYHVPIILCTVFFNVFQNTIALSFILRLPKWVTICIIVLCAIATIMQVLLARAFKIIETPIHLTLAQQAFLSAIRQTLAASKKKLHGSRVAQFSELENTNHQTETLYVSIDSDKIVYETLGTDDTTVIKNIIKAQELGKNFPRDQEELLALKKEIFSIVLRRQELQNDLVVVISPQEYAVMDKPFIHLSLSKNKKNFDYALQCIAQQYHTHLHILSVDKEHYQNISFEKLPIQKKYCVLAYSYEPTLLMRNNVEQVNQIPLAAPEVYAPSMSLKRYISSHEYREKTSYCALSTRVLCALPTFIFLVTLPIFGATLQGISSLNDVLAQCTLQDISGYSRLAVILPGMGIGASKATMTYVTKVPSSKERTRQIILFLRDNFKVTHFLKWCCSSDRKLFEDLCKIFSFDCSLLLVKRLLILLYYIVPLFVKIFGYFAAIGTLLFYAGLGLFFSNSGLYELIAFFNHPAGYTPSHESTDYSNVSLTIFSFLMCIGIAILNGFFNQGWDAVKLFTRYAKEIKKYLHDCIESATATSLCHVLRVPEPIQDIYTKNTKGQNVILFLTLIDSFAASATAYYGSTKITAACATLYPPLDTNNLCAILNLLIAVSIYISQTCFSFEQYKRDEKVGGNLWGKLFAVHFPEYLKQAFGIRDAIQYPHTRGALNYKHQCFNRLQPSFTHFSHNFNSRISLLTTSSSGKMALL